MEIAAKPHVSSPSRVSGPTDRRQEVEIGVSARLTCHESTCNRTVLSGFGPSNFAIGKITRPIPVPSIAVSSILNP
jgi:hypothetical protein